MLCVFVRVGMFLCIVIVVVVYDGFKRKKKKTISVTVHKLPRGGLISIRDILMQKTIGPQEK